MRRTWLVPTVLVAMVSSYACSAKLGGSVEVNGEKLGLSSCRNGVAFGFRGVQLTTKSGLRLRIGALPTGAAGVIVMPKGESVGTELGVPCGAFSISDQKSTINGVRNVEGKAILDCEAAGFKIKGEVSFENCH